MRAAFVASGGYGEAGDAEGARSRRAGRGRPNELGILLAGPNGQGVISTADVDVRADRRAVSAAGPDLAWRARAATCVSAFLNYAVLTGVGVSKAISCGNSAQTTLADYLEYFAADPDTAVALAYLEGVRRRRAFLRRACARLDAREAARRC